MRSLTRGATLSAVPDKPGGRCEAGHRHGRFRRQEGGASAALFNSSVYCCRSLPNRVLSRLVRYARISGHSSRGGPSGCQSAATLPGNWRTYGPKGSDLDTPLNRPHGTNTQRPRKLADRPDCLEGPPYQLNRPNERPRRMWMQPIERCYRNRSKSRLFQLLFQPTPDKGSFIR